MKIGIFGGSFNPIHNAHLKIAEVFSIEARLDKCLFIPAYVSPFKISDPYYFHIDSKHRKKMVELAIEDYNNFEVEDYELNKGGISFTYDTLAYLKNKYSDSNFYMLIGGDQAKYFTQWKNWEQIIETATLCIASRLDTLKAEEKENITKDLTLQDHVPVWLNTPVIPYSATDIRKKITEGYDASDYLPQRVYEYILDNNLYL